MFFPCYNEAENLPALIHDALAAAPSLADHFELIIVDDGSRDETATIAQGLAAAHPGVVRFVRHKQNLAMVQRCARDFRQRATAGLRSLTEIVSSELPILPGLSALLITPRRLSLLGFGFAEQTPCSDSPMLPYTDSRIAFGLA